MRAVNPSASTLDITLGDRGVCGWSDDASADTTADGTANRERVAMNAFRSVERPSSPQMMVNSCREESVSTNSWWIAVQSWMEMSAYTLD